MGQAPFNRPLLGPAYRQPPFFDQHPFDSTVVDYTKFAEHLVRVISTLHQGAVLAIDAPWGSGKTFFARNFEAHLRADGWKAAYVDAFAYDYLEDPFLFLASAVHTLASSKPAKKNLARVAGRVGKALIPVAVKAVNVATAGVLDLEETGKAVVDAIAAAGEKAIENRISEFEKERKSFEAFAQRLREVAEQESSATERPLVIFVDELDRCRPDFAVKTLERIKHLFDVPNIVFVLLLHGLQLEHAVRGLYGDIDAPAYLRKFVHFTLPLPLNRQQTPSQSEVANYINRLSSRLDLRERHSEFRSAMETLREVAPYLGMTFRDAERAVIEIALSDFGRRLDETMMRTLAYVIALKIAARPLYEVILARKLEGITEHTRMLQEAVKRGFHEHTSVLFCDIVDCHITQGVPPEAAERWKRVSYSYSKSPAELFSFLARR